VTQSHWDIEDETEYEVEPRHKRIKNYEPERLADEETETFNFITTYHPSRHEAGWLLSSLQSFYIQNLITDVQASVKGGKEASVYRCAAHPNLQEEFVAAKVYRPRRFRNLRNDAMYREGRAILTADGRAAKKTDHRLMRAIGKKTDFGVQAAHTSWLMYEFTTLQHLYDVGAAVPKPFAAAENAILMGYVGDGNRPAPTLIETDVKRDEAEELFAEVLRNIRLLFAQGYVHGDLSAYNILYWQGKITLIDFPQVTNWAGNPNAAMILRRDIQRVTEYFERYDIEMDIDDLMAEFTDQIDAVSGG
jgi:RIO kinase 1